MAEDNRHALAAGDLQSAASLFKRVLAVAPADEARSRVAARLYEILVGSLQSYDDAYSFFARDGLTLRQSIEARQFAVREYCNLHGLWKGEGT